MSSEGSVISTASRIRQFGLYRTIDTRTDEFLRSSRRRQIRQGCACAAISTAITVTVVVSVILVYEYSINSESNLNKKIPAKPNWLALINDSDLTQTELIFEKKINFDRTTLKLLPILLKALNKNRYLEKIFEDYSSSSPPYEGKDGTDTYFQRNVFSDAKNWLKMPAPRIYTIDYKTSPLTYSKLPSSHLSYLNKIRKMKNYERMLNYFDKMINDKVSSSRSNVAIHRDFTYTENPLKSVTQPMKKNVTKGINSHKTNRSNSTKAVNITGKIKYKSKHNMTLNKQKQNIETKKHGINITKDISKPVKKIKTKKTNETKRYCKCPKDMGFILNKLIQTLEILVTNVTSKTQNQNCDKNNKSNVSIHEKNESLIKVEVTSKPTKTEIIPDSTTSPTMRKEIEKPESISENTTQSNMLLSNVNKTSTRHNITSQSGNILSKIVKVSNKFDDLYNNPNVTDKPKKIKNQSVEDRSVLQIPKTNYKESPMYETYNHELTPLDVVTTEKQQRTTELIKPIKTFTRPYEVSVSSESLLDPMAIIPHYKNSEMPLFKNDEYDDYFFTTPKALKDSEDLDGHSFELVKTKSIMSSIPDNNESIKVNNNLKKIRVTSKPANLQTVTKNTDLMMRKMADLIYLPKIPIEITTVLTSTSTIKKDDIDQNSNIIGKNTSLKDKKVTSLLKHVIKMQRPIEPANESQSSGGDQGNSEDSDEEELMADSAKPPETTEIPIVNKKYNKSFYDDDNSTPPPSKTEKQKSHDKINSAKSMLPNMRPIYLEIRRSNDWRPEDHDDYDINLTNNVFDLPDV